MIVFTIPYPCGSGASAWSREYGLNAIYAGKHWTARKRDAQYWHSMVASELRRQGVARHVLKKPVSISFWWCSRMDLDNHAYQRKLIIDSIKGWIIADDDKRRVRELHDYYHVAPHIRVEIREMDT